MNTYIKYNNFPGKDTKEDLYLEKESEMVSLSVFWKSHQISWNVTTYVKKFGKGVVFFKYMMMIRFHCSYWQMNIQSQAQV